MKNMRRVVVLMGTVAIGGAASTLIASGCGGDDTSTPAGDGGGLDSTATDGANPQSDGEPPGTDAGEDAKPDVIAPVDAGEGGTMPVPDASPDSGEGGIALSVTTFPRLVAAALCNRFENCCSTPDAGLVFDTNGCVSRYLNFGYAGSSTGESLIDAGHVAFDRTEGQSCLDQIAAIDCSANLRTSAQEQSIITACFGALTGTLTAGAPCTDSIECAPSEFCDPQDGGGSACAPLRVAGQSCADFGSSGFVASDTACSYRGSGNTGLTCKNGDFATYGDIPLNQWVCSSQQPTGSGCFVNVDCSSRLCDPGANSSVYKCAQSETFIYPFACNSFFVPPSAIPVDGGSDAGPVDAGHD